MCETMFLLLADQRDESSGRFGQQVQARYVALNFKAFTFQAGTGDALVAQAVQFDQLAQPNGEFGSIEAAGVAGAEHVLQIGRQPGVRLQARLCDEAVLRLEYVLIGR